MNKNYSVRHISTYDQRYSWFKGPVNWLLVPWCPLIASVFKRVLACNCLRASVPISADKPVSARQCPATAL